MNRTTRQLVLYFLFISAFFSTSKAQTGAALDFDGSSDYVSAPSLTLGSNWTAEAWANPSSVSSSNWQVILGQAFWNNNQGFVIAIVSGTLFAEGPQGMHIETSISPNVWTHVALSYSNGIYAFYKNGILIGTQVAPFTDATTPFYIGCRNNNNNSGLGDYYQGALDEVRLWSNTRSQCEILSFMNCEIPTTATNLSSNYHFNQGIAASSNGTVTSLLDDSGNNYTGTLNSFALSGSTSNWISPGAVTSGFTTTSIPNSEINITGNGNSILDGDNSPSSSDFTDFGLSNTQTFVIESSGAGTLNAGIPFFTGANANQFSITVAPSQILAATSGSTSFVITFTPTSPGTKTAIVNIYNSDCSEPIYDFVITATAVAAEALNFDGINDGISRPVFSALNSSLTLQAKVNLSATTGFNQAIVYNGNTSNSGYGLFLQPGSREVHVLYGGVVFLATGYSLTLNQWTSLSLVLENNISKVFADGILVSTFFIANPTIPAGNFMIGVNNLGTENFNGSIDEVLFWNKPLSQCEIQTILNAEITSTASGLVANYHFNQGVPSGSNTAETILIDAAGTNTATLSNFDLTGGSLSNWISPGGVVSGFTAVSTPSAEINVQGLGNNILDGATITGTINATDFGSSFTRTFVIQNSGTGPMNIGAAYLSGANASDFTLTGLPSSTLAASASTSLVVVFTPTSAGSRTAEINFTTNDCDEGLFNFVIKADATSSALDFDGTSDWVSTTVDADTDVMPNTTWLSWVYPTSYPSNYEMILSTDDGGWDRFISLYNNEIRASNGSTFVTVSTFTTNQWVHLAVVYKQSVNEMLVYVNGIQHGPYTTSFANGTTLNNLSLSDATFPFQGKLDEVRIWSSARSQCEILTFKDCEVPNAAPNLIANYHFNNGLAFGSNPTFTTLTDFSGNNNHGTLNTFSLSGTNSNWVNTGAIPLGYTVSSLPTATLNITGNGNNIANASVVPSLGNHTDFGGVSSRTFVIQNIGSGTLFINSPITILGAASNDFSVTVAPSASLGVSGSSSFVVNFVPTAIGTRSALVNINSSDCANPNYVFAIQAIGLPADALSFDGTNDYVNMPNIVNTFSNGIISGEAWVMTEATGGGYQSIIKNWGETNSGAFHFGLDNSFNYPEIVITQSNGSVVSVSDPNALSTGIWYHLAFVADGSQLHLYKNGIEVGTPSNYDGTLKTSFTPLYIGAKPNDLGTSTSTLYPGVWNGKLDEIRLWTSARSQCQIQTFMNCEIPTTAIGLVSNYHFNQGVPSGSNSAVTTLTSAAVAHTGTLTNFALTGSVSNWVVPGAIAAGYTLTTLPSASINVTGNGNTIPNGSSTPTVTNFTDIGTNTNATFVIQNIHTGTSTLNVGPIYFSGVGASQFTVSTVPSPSISANGNSSFVVTFTPTSVGLHTAVVNVRSSDCSFPTYSFVISASATPASALNFDGSNDYVQIVDPNFGTSDFTLETWANVNSFTINTYLMSTRTFEGGANGNYWDFGVSASSGSVYFETADTGPAPYTFIGNTTSTISLSTWNHLAVVRSGLNVSLYVNGILKANATYTSIPSLITGNNSLRLSGSGINLALLNGSMDEVRIWNVARSQCQIQQFMNAEITSTASGLIANYHFNQGVPSGSNTAITSLTDAAGVNTGTLANFALSGTTSNWITPSAVANNFTSTVAPTATLNVYGNGNLVPMGVTTSTANYTDFGLATNRTFLVHNLGSGTLNTGTIFFGGANASNFSVTSLPSATIAGSSNSPFIISFTATALGSQSAIVNITSNDCTNPTFSFVITASTSPAEALDFDGVDDFVSLSSNTAIPVGNSSYCIEAWIKPNAFGNYGIIGWGNYSNTNQVNAFRLHSSGLLINYWWGNDISVSAPTLTNGAWHHVAATFDGTMRAIYVDGIMGANDFPTGHNVPNNANMRIGCTAPTLFEYFNGSIDEVRIWNTSRTQCEIQSFMNAEITSTASGLVANYHFNQGVPFGPNTGTNVLLDAAGSFTGALTNFSLSGLTSNWISPGGVISGSTTPNVPTATLSLSGNSNPILAGSTTPSVSNFTDFQTNATRTFVIQNSGTGSLFINSPIIFSGTAANNFSVTTVPAGTLGTSATTSFVISYSPTTLSTQTAIVIINSSDCSSPNFSFVITASATPAAALNFDGVDDVVNCGTDPSLDISIGTWEAWVKLSTLATNSRIFFKEITDGGGTGMYETFFLASNGKFNGDLKIGLTTYQVAGTISPTTNTWYHVAATYDGTYFRLYVNGVLDGITNVSGGNMNPGTGRLSLGASITSPLASGLTGVLDEARLWNVVRSQCEIQTYMNAEITSTASGLVANYHFNQGVPFGPNTGSVSLLDATGVNTGTLVNFALSGIISNWVTPGGVISGSNTPNIPTATLSLSGNGNPILAGSTTPTVSNFTNFQTNASRTFVIQNSGTGTLSINSPITFSGTAAANFSVTSVPAGTLGTSATTSFVISYSPTTLSTQTAIVIINSSDCSSPNFSFVISATSPTASALNFDGTDDRVNTIDINPATHSVMTFEAWVYRTGGSGVQTIIGNDDGGFDRALVVNSNIVHIWAGRDIVTTFTSNLNTWEHYAVTWSSSEVRCIKNGSEIFSTSGQSASSSTLNAGIGAMVASWLFPFQGMIDEARIWNTARTQCEILTYMNCEIPTTASGLLANYHFNQGIPFGSNSTFSLATDATGANTGTLSNFSLNGSTSNWVSPGAVVSGNTLTTLPSATLSLSGNGNAINAGSSTISLSNHTDFGNSSTRTYVLQNSGTGNLYVNTQITLSGANASDFSITATPSSTITNSSSGSLTVIFIPASVGTKTAIVTINSSDCTSPTYSFMIGGTASIASALNFDGTNDFASRTVFNTQTNNLTLQARVNWNGLDASNKFIAHNGNSGTNGYGLYVAANTNSLYAIFGGINAYYTGFNLTANQWTALSLVIETNKISFYANGVLTSTINTGTNPSVPSGSFNVGVGINQGTENFNGSIDEVLLWTKALNACEIPFYLNCEIPTSSASLVANYHFNQGIGGSINTTFTTVTDASGNNNTLSLGNFGLNGISSNWINPGAVVSGSNCGVYSESEINVIGNAISIVDGATTPTLSNHSDFGNISSTGIIVRTFSIQNLGSSTLAINSISLSGINASQFSVSGLSPASPIASGSTAVFSVTYAPTSGGISSATINISNNDCDESLFDFAITGSVTAAASFRFDGNNDYINLGNILTASYTKETWVNISTSTNGNNFLSSGSGTVGTALWAPGIYSYQLSAGHNVNWNVVQDPTPLVPGTWYHVAVTYDAASNSMTLYKNGVSVSTNTVLPFSGTDPLSIGAFSGSFVTTGFMDEVRIWNRPLCQAEIQNNMNCEIPTTAPGLIANYHFNQGIGYGSNTTNSTVIDASGNNATGTFSNVALTGTISNWSSNTAITSGSSCPIYLTPEINLTGNNTSIADGDLTPSLSDHTDFAGLCINNSLVRTFTIQNTGNTTLTVSSMTIIGVNASDFSISVLSPASPISASNQAVFTVTFTPASAGVKSATINIANSDCNEALYDFVITGTCNPLPIVTANASNSVICNTFSTSVFGTGANTYTWSGGVTNNTAFTPSISSSYTVNGTNTLTGCTSTNSAVQSITVNLTPTVSASSINSVICFGETSTLVASGAATYTWEPGSINGTSITIAPSTSLIYSVTGTSSNACVATNTVNLAVTVNTLPIVSAATTDSVICLNFTTSLIGSGADTYTWNGNVNNGIAFSPTITQTYTVNGTNTLTGCTSTNSAIQSITVNSLPSVTASTSNSIICEGFAATLTASGANTYTWLPGSLIGSNVSPSPSVTTDFTLTGTSLEGCTNTNVAVQTISVNTIPTVSASVSNTIICIGGTISLIGSGASTYTWSNGVTDNTAFSPSVSSSYTVNGTNNAGCTNTNLATVSVTVNNLPVISILVSDSVLCFGDTTNVQASGALTYTWSGGISNNSNFSPSVSTMYTVTATDLNTCTNTAVTGITVNALPILTISTTQDPACIAQTQTLSVRGALSYTWNTLATDSNISIVPMVATNYSVIATDLKGCVNTSTFVQQVTVCEILVFTGISANGDGLNDVMTIQNIESYPQNKVTVFNRWGKEVFSMTGYNNLDKAWPLSEDVPKLPPSTYFYIIDLGDGSQPTKGWVELIKN